MKILLPKTLANINNDLGVSFFLAGPVLGGDDWQAKGAEILERSHPNPCAIIPCRYDNNHHLSPLKVGGDEKYFDRQLTWERFYLGEASRFGCLIFWLPCESKTKPRCDGNPYAMDTRREIGEWLGHLMHDPSLRVVIGAEPEFPGLSQIQRSYSLGLGEDFPIFGTLEETIAGAVKRAS